jgi:hypothetical protein
MSEEKKGIQRTRSYAKKLNAQTVPDGSMLKLQCQTWSLGPEPCGRHRRGGK